MCLNSKTHKSIQSMAIASEATKTQVNRIFKH